MSNKEFDLLTYGEVMLRLSPPMNERMVRGEIFEKRAGGAEMNVAVGASLLGLKTGFISKVPANDMGTFIKNSVRFNGVSDKYIIGDETDDARLGIYYYESGATPRKPSVVYDRKYSSINKMKVENLPEEIFTSTECFHTCGISLAISEEAKTTTLELIKKFKAAGALISFDVNYRANLWSEEDARATLEEVFKYVDILFISEETSRRMFRKTGKLEDIMKSYCEEYGVSLVATTQRQVISPKKHNFGSIIYCDRCKKYFTEKMYEDIDVIDRIGSGDAFVSGALYGFLKFDSPLKALQYGNATSAVKNTVPGDMISTSLKEIERIISDHNTDGPKSEMNR